MLAITQCLHCTCLCLQIPVKQCPPSRPLEKTFHFFFSSQNRILACIFFLQSRYMHTGTMFGRNIRFSLFQHIFTDFKAICLIVQKKEDPITDNYKNYKFEGNKIQFSLYKFCKIHIVYYKEAFKRPKKKPAWLLEEDE